MSKQDTDPGAVWHYDPKTRLTERIQELINAPGPASIADVVQLRENVDDMVDGEAVSHEMKPVVVDAKKANDLDIAAGKDDLVGYTPTLLEGLEAIPDEGERRRTYDALCFVLDAAYRLGRSADPLNEMQRSQAKNTAGMRTAKAKQHASDLAKRDEIVRSVIDERERLGEQVSWDKVKDQLLAAGASAILESTFYRIKRRLKKSRSTLQG